MKHKQLKAAIAIDSWKLDIFRSHLWQASYTFTQGPGLTSDTLLLIVETNNITTLQRVIESAERECKISFHKVIK